MRGFDPKWQDVPHFIIGITKEIWEEREIGSLRHRYADGLIVRSPASVVVDNSNGYLAALVEPLGGKMTVISPEEAAAGKKRGSFDLILIDGAVETMPPALAKRLSVDGRVVTGLVHGGVTALAIGRRTGKDVAFRRVEDIALPRLTAFETPKSWAF